MQQTIQQLDRRTNIFTYMDSKAKGRSVKSGCWVKCGIYVSKYVGLISKLDATNNQSQPL